MSILRRLTAPGIVRIYLALAVVMQHLGFPWIGGLAVLIFFILSGYWISILWRVKYQRCRHPYLLFILSRYWRLLPVYFTCLLLTGLVIWRFTGWWHSWTLRFTDPRWILSNSMILGCASSPNFLPTTWSLDIEMQFYLIAPLIIALAAVVTRGALGRLAAGLLFIILAVGYFFLPLGMNLGPYLIFFVTGCVMANVRWKPSAILACSCAVAAVALFLGAHWHFQLLHPGSAVDRYIRWPFFVCAALAVPFLAWSLEQRSDHLDRILGDLAYPIYLFHYIAFLLIDHINFFHNMAAPIRATIDLLLVAAASLAIYFLIDRPIERSRRAYVEFQATHSGRDPRPA